MNEFLLEFTPTNGGRTCSIFVREISGEQELGDSSNPVSPPQSSRSRKGGKSKKRISGKQGTTHIQFRRLTNASGWRLSLVDPYVKQVIKRNSGNESSHSSLVGPNDDAAINKEQVVISEEDGVRLSLLFRTIARMQKMTKVHHILLSIKSMIREESYYWYSKVFSNHYSTKGVKAFRILIGE